MSSVMSKEIEDIVLETLHNIVSNLRLEQSIKSQKGSKSSAESAISQEIEDFVLGTLQNIVVDHQDRRSQMDMGVTHSSSKYGTSSIELVTGESKEAMVYVNEVLQNVLAEMKDEIAESVERTSGNSSDTGSADIQTMILEYLQRALNDTSESETLDKAFEFFNPEDVKRVLLETITGTIQSVKENKFSYSDLSLLFEAAKRFFDEADPGIKFKVDDTVTAELVIDLLENVKMKLETIDIKRKTLDHISSQLATLGMNVASETCSPENIRSEGSVASSLLSELVKDVIARISEQLSSSARNESGEPDPKNGETSDIVEENTNNNDKTVSTSSSKTSDTKRDVNYNRKLSVSTANSCTSSLMSETNKSCEESKRLRPDDGKNEHQEKKAVNDRREKQERKLPRRSTESRLVIRQTKTHTKPGPESKKEISCKMSTQQRSEELRRPKIICYLEKTTIKENRKISKGSTPKRSVKASSSDKKATTKNSFTPAISSSAFTRTSVTPKARSKIVTNNMSIKKSSKQNKGEANKFEIQPPSEREVPERPAELKSLCGVHRTKISFREQPDDSLAHNSECHSDRPTHYK